MCWLEEEVDPKRKAFPLLVILRRIYKTLTICHWHYQFILICLHFNKCSQDGGKQSNVLKLETIVYYRNHVLSAGSNESISASSLFHAEPAICTKAHLSWGGVVLSRYPSVEQLRMSRKRTEALEKTKTGMDTDQRPLTALLAHFHLNLSTNGIVSQN